MSIEVESKESQSPNGHLSRAATSIATYERLPIWRQRRYQLGALIVVIAFAAAVVGNNLLARQYTPEGAVRQYMVALQAGDAAKAWDQIQVSAPSAPVAANITDRIALQAALAVGKPDIRDFTVTGTSQVDSTTTAVDVTYDISGGSQKAKFVVRRSGATHFGIYPVWHVLITPTILQITLPKGTSGVSIDAKAIALPQGKSSVAVLPVPHRLQFNATAMVAAQTVSVDAFDSLSQSVTPTPTLTPDGLAKAKAVVAAYLDSCTKQSGLSPQGCPQSLSNGFVSSGRWQLVGDPTDGLSIGFDKDLNPVGTGHFQMMIAYEEAGYTGTLHDTSSGGYSAALLLTSSDITVTSINSANGLPGMQRPAGATDQAAEALVAAAFAQCAGARATAQADCPQKLAAADPSNVTWQLSGNPLTGATVSFDQQSGRVTVQGNFNMTAKYFVQGYPYNRASYTSAYKAYLLWDGQALKLVTISGDSG